MRQIISYTVFLFLSFALIDSPLLAMQVLTCEEPPTNYTAEDGSITGISTDIVKELLRRTKTTAPIRLIPWPRAYEKALKEPNIVLFTAGRTPAREGLFHWIGPLLIKRWVLFKKDDAPHIINSLSDARAVHRIVVLRNDARAQFLRKKGFTNLLEVASHKQALQMLSLGRADLWPSSLMEASLVAQSAGIDYQKISVAYVLKTIYPHIILSKKTSPEVVKLWQDAFQALRADGTLAAIGAAWGKKLGRPIIMRNGMLSFSKPVSSQHL